MKVALITLGLMVALDVSAEPRPRSRPRTPPPAPAPATPVAPPAPSIPAFAPCTVPQKKFLDEALDAHQQEGIDQSGIMTNRANQVVGYYAWNDRGEMHAEVCEFLEKPDEVIGNEWSVWDAGTQTSFSSSPASWAVDQSYSISQDGSRASIKLLKILPAAVSVQFTVWNSDASKAVRQDVLQFRK